MLSYFYILALYSRIFSHFDTFLMRFRAFTSIQAEYQALSMNKIISSFLSRGRRYWEGRLARSGKTYFCSILCHVNCIRSLLLTLFAVVCYAVCAPITIPIHIILLHWCHTKCKYIQTTTKMERQDRRSLKYILIEWMRLICVHTWCLFIDLTTWCLTWVEKQQQKLLQQQLQDISNI